MGAPDQVQESAHQVPGTASGGGGCSSFEVQEALPPAAPGGVHEEFVTRDLLWHQAQLRVSPHGGAAHLRPSHNERGCFC